jgi:hypothetical protein
MTELEQTMDRRQIGKWDSPIAGIMGLPDTERLLVLDDLRTQLVRLDATGPGHTELSGEDRLTAAMAAENGRTDSSVASEFNTTRRVVSDARRDFRAAVAFCRPDLLSTGYTISDDEQRRIDRLRQSQRESNIINTALRTPSVKHAFLHIPHIGKLLEVFSQYSTVTPVLDEYEIPYSRHDEYARNRAVRNFIFTDKPYDGIRRLSQRVLLANWLQSGTSWDGHYLENLISGMLVEHLTCVPHHDHTLVQNQRKFIVEMLRQEYETFKADEDFYSSSDFDIVFPGKSGKKAVDFHDVSVVDSYHAYAFSGVYPSSIRRFAKAVVDGDYSTELALNMGGDLRYSLKSKRLIAWAGLTLLENLCLDNNPNVIPTELFSTSRKKYMARARAEIRSLDIVKSYKHT